MSEEPDLTVAEVASMLEVTPATIRRWIRDRQLPGAHKPGGNTGWRIPRADVQRMRPPTTEDISVARGLEMPRNPSG